MIQIQEEEILIQNILSGKNKKESEKQLYNKYKIIIRDYVKSIFFKYRIDDPEIDDHVSMIMIKIFLNLDKFNPERSKFKTWAFSISKHYMLNVWRKQATTITTCSLNNDAFVESDISNTPDFNVAELNISNNPKFEDNSTLTYLSTQISPKDYKMLDMKYNQGYNYGEIGDVFNLTSTTVSNRVNYLKTKLKRDNPQIILEN